ncbi:TPA: AMP-binding protein [Pseudomonas aeruginosa]|nr:AMP-binding protein [Pseudomonas aeruginosa]
MRDYATTAAGFDLQRTAAATLSGTLQALNACVECCDRHALPGRIALFWEGKDGSRASYTFSELKALSGRFANFLQAQGVRPGDCVAGLLPRTPELLVTILGAWRLGAVYQPLFTAFGPKAIEHRVATAGSKVLVTDAANRDKLDELADPPLAVTVGGPKGQGIRRGDFSFWAELERYPAEFEPVPRSGEDPFLMMFTSGTTGLAKPVPVPLKAILALDRRRSPLMWFPGYQGLETAAFVGDYYLSGDTVELNEDGSISFVGRADDVITTSGYRVGPFDVESALIEHPAVMEAAVIGKPDPERTELVKAFVVLCAGHRPTPELADALQRYVRQRLSAHAYPREIEFLEELPKTPSGKIQRFLLRNQEIARQREAAPRAAAAN